MPDIREDADGIAIKPQHKSVKLQASHVPATPGLPHGRQSHDGHQSSFGTDLEHGATVLGGLYERPAVLEQGYLAL